MLVSGALFVLIMAGCWLYCLTDAVCTPAVAFRGWPKSVWIGIIATTFLVGAIAWVAVRPASRVRYKRYPRFPRYRHPRYPRFTTGHRIMPTHTYVYWYPDWAAADDSVARHPAGRSRKIQAEGWAPPKGPDDDPDFLRELDRRIKDIRDDESE
jgi:hypothetical protein